MILQERHITSVKSTIIALSCSMIPKQYTTKKGSGPFSSKIQNISFPQILPSLSLQLTCWMGGLLMESGGIFQFTSSLTKRYFSKWLFPDRSSDLPSSIDSLVQDIIKNMSLSDLLQYRVHGHNFPKEATSNIYGCKALKSLHLQKCIYARNYPKYSQMTQQQLHQKMI